MEQDDLGAPPLAQIPVRIELTHHDQAIRAGRKLVQLQVDVLLLERLHSSG